MIDDPPLKNRNRGIDASYWLAWLALATSLLYLIASYGSGGWNYSDIQSSDALFIARFYRNVWASGTLAGWNLPTNPYIFPDMLLFIPLDIVLHLITGNSYVTVILYGIAQLLLLLIGFLLLQRQLFGKRRFAQIATVQIFTLCIILFAVTKQDFFDFIFMACFHFGVLTVIPFATLAMLRIMQPESPVKVQRRALLILLVLTLLTSLSDSLFVVQFVLPALLASLAWFRRKQMVWRPLLLMNGVLLLASVAGQWLRLWLVPLDVIEHFAEKSGWAGLTTSFSFLASQILDIAVNNPFFASLWLTSTMALVVLLFTTLVRLHWGENAGRPLLMVVLLVLASMAVTIVTALATGNFFERSNFRYILSALYLPILTGWPLLLAGSLPRSQWKGEVTFNQGSYLVGAATSVISVFLLGYMLFTVQWSGVPSAIAYRDPFVTCLDRETALRHLHYGLATYRQAISTSVLSANDLEIVQVLDGRFMPYLWNNNRYLYQEPFEFAVLNQGGAPKEQIAEDLAVQKFGPPADSFSCESSKIFAYNRPSDVQFRNWFVNRPELAAFNHTGDGSLFFGYSLPSMIGGVVIGFSQGVSEQWGNGDGTLAYAPLTGLPAGRYVVSFDLYADSAKTGDWEVVTNLPNKAQVVATGLITNSGKSRLTTQFDLREASNAEVRVNYSGHGTLFVDTICVQRLDPSQTAPDACHAPGAAPMPASAEGNWNPLHPYADAFSESRTVDFAWQWTGPPLSSDQAFEVRIWRKGDTVHYGAHDAKASREMVRQIGDSYILRLDLNGAYSVMQDGAGDYEWSVAIVRVEPSYQDLQIEAPSRPLSLLP